MEKLRNLPHNFKCSNIQIIGVPEGEEEKERVTYKGVPIRLSADFSKETLEARRGWKEVFQVMKGKDLYPKLLYPQSYHLGRADKVLPR